MTDGSLSPTRRRRKEARPAEIIAAGLAEFGERGFGAARIEDIARRAGIAKGTVFRYFPTKEALFEATITAHLAPVFDQAMGMLDHYEGPTLPVLRMLLDNVYGRLEENQLPVLMRMMISEGQRFPALLEIYHRESLMRGQALLRRILDRGVARGEFQASAAMALPMVLMAPALMAAVWRMTFDGLQPLPLEQFRAAHWAMLTGALGVATTG
jgi:AcrR family transcriptional regulator